jgi:hypothetical protein
MTTKQSLLGLMIGLAVSAPVIAQEKPDLTLRYADLTQREQLQFSMKGHPDLTRPVGGLAWEFPPTTYATVGFDPELKTFCMEPLVTVTSGMEYGFRIDTFGTPKDFGLADDEAGRKMAIRRMKFVRELYGRYYIDTVRDPNMSAAAFQTALWEVTQETEVPDGPMPFSLFTGTFKVNYPNLNESPAFVQRAQKYVQSLTGDDASFAESTVLAGQTLVRLTGLNSLTGAAGQSQLSTRAIGGGGAFPGPAQSIASTSMGGGFGQQQQPNLNAYRGGLLGTGGGFGGGSGGGLGNGGGSGFVSGGGGTTVNTGGTDSSNPGGNPETPTNPTNPNIVINNNPVFNNNNNNTNTNNNDPVNNNTNNNSNNQSQNQNQNQNQQQQQQQNQNQDQHDDHHGHDHDPGHPVTPVPAPPAAVLGMVALGMFGLRKFRGRKQNS